MDKASLKIVYTITERGERKFWNRIGIASVNRDGSLNVKLDAVPVNGMLHVRDYTPRDESTDQGRVASPRSAQQQPLDELSSVF